MSVVVVVLLVVLWAWILLPGAVRERREASPAVSVSRFEGTMARLARANRIRPGRDLSREPQTLAEKIVAARHVEAGVASDPAAWAARRRRHVVGVLGGSSTLAFLLGRTVGGPTWVLFWTVAALMAVYIGLLAHRWVRVSREEAIPLVRPPATPRPSSVAPGLAAMAAAAGEPVDGRYAAEVYEPPAARVADL